MRALRKALRPFVLLLLVVGALLSARLGFSHFARARFAKAQEVHAPRSVETLGPLPDVLVESSGLGVSRAHPGVLWTHNDSGDRPRFYAIDTTARLLGTWDVRGAQARDWEDMALARCPPSVATADLSRTDCLWLADTGDNGLERDTLTVYLVSEPDPSDPARAVDLLGRIRYRYPDGAHDVEGVAVDREGDLVFVTKGRTPDILLFELPASAVDAALRASCSRPGAACRSSRAGRSDGSSPAPPSARTGRRSPCAPTRRSGSSRGRCRATSTRSPRAFSAGSSRAVRRWTGRTPPPFS
jgi:hypothetical protein